MTVCSVLNSSCGILELQNRGIASRSIILYYAFHSFLKFKARLGVLAEENERQHEVVEYIFI